jgi:GH25 family lysozyme M1 (1,4-beta-N-acetylmuramidase)
MLRTGNSFYTHKSHVMKQSLLIIIFLQSLLNVNAQNTEEPDFAMGRSMKSDKAQTINNPKLISNLSRGIRAISGLKLNHDKLYGCYGVDISHYEGNIKWPSFIKDSLPNKVFFVFSKATQGVAGVDKMYEKNNATAKSRGFLVGAYHFYSQTADPEAQADNFIQHVKLEKGDLMPVLDIEKNCLKDCAVTPDLLIPKSQLIKNLKIFIKKLEEHYNTKVVIYTGEAFYHDYLFEDFKDQYFWIAKYAKAPPKCFTIGKADTLRNPCFSTSLLGCWQYSQSGTFKGISGNVDINFMSNYYLSKWIID